MRKRKADTPHQMSHFEKLLLLTPDQYRLFKYGYLDASGNPVKKPDAPAAASGADVRGIVDSLLNRSPPDKEELK